MSDEFIVFVTSDDVRVQAARNSRVMDMTTIQEMLKECSSHDLEIPLPFTSSILHLVLSYPVLENNFIEKLPIETILDLLNAADYLEDEDLLEDVMNSLCEILRTYNSVEEMRQKLEIMNDFPTKTDNNRLWDTSSCLMKDENGYEKIVIGYLGENTS